MKVEGGGYYLREVNDGVRTVIIDVNIIIDVNM